MDSATLGTEEQTALEIVKLGYAVDDPTDRNRCLSFTVGFDTLAGAQAAVRAIDAYNDFDGETVAEALSKIAGTGGAIGAPGFSVGRESSPCIYVNKLDSRPGSEQNLERIKQALIDARADEVDEVQDGAGSRFGATIRAWWD